MNPQNGKRPQNSFTSIRTMQAPQGDFPVSHRERRSERATQRIDRTLHDASKGQGQADGSMTHFTLVPMIRSA